MPLFVTNAIDDQPLPVYGDGKQRRDYQYVIDHCAGIDVVLQRGTPGEIYNVGTGSEMENLRMVEILLDELGKPSSLIQHVEDRPGHDRRYCLNVDKLRALGWQPRTLTKRRSGQPCAGMWPTSGGGARSSQGSSRSITGGCTATARSSAPAEKQPQYSSDS